MESVDKLAGCGVKLLPPDNGSKKDWYWVLRKGLWEKHYGPYAPYSRHCEYPPDTPGTTDLGDARFCQDCGRKYGLEW